MISLEKQLEKACNRIDKNFTDIPAYIILFKAAMQYKFDHKLIYNDEFFSGWVSNNMFRIALTPVTKKSQAIAGVIVGRNNRNYGFFFGYKSTITHTYYNKAKLLVSEENNTKKIFEKKFKEPIVEPKYSPN